MLFARGKLMDHRKEQLRKELLEQEAELCPFHPKIVSEGFAFSPSLSKRIKSVAKFPKPEVSSFVAIMTFNLNKMVCIYDRSAAMTGPRTCHRVVKMDNGREISASRCTRSSVSAVKTVA